MGSITHIVDGDGAVQNRYEYDAWGNVTEQTETVPNRFKFNDQQLDPISQQYYLRARFYNPVIARFTQEDTYRGDGLNLYAYCQNNPVVYEDPTGNACEPQANLLQKQQGKTTYTNQSGHTFTQDANNRWHDASGRFTSDPTGVNQPKKPKATVPTDNSVADFYVTPNRDVIPSHRSDFDHNLSLMTERNEKYVGNSSIGPVRVRVEYAHSATLGYTGSDNDHLTPHIHVEHRENGTTGGWGKGSSNKISLPQSWLR